LREEPFRQYLLTEIQKFVFPMSPTWYGLMF
jgi:hypothetical protein